MEDKKSPPPGEQVLSFLIRTLTVGTGISPVRRLSALAGFTAGMEFHQSPKITDLQFT